MNTIRTLACTALLASLAACQNSQAPAAPSASATKPADNGGGLTGMIGDAMDKAAEQLCSADKTKRMTTYLHCDTHGMGARDTQRPRSRI